LKCCLCLKKFEKDSDDKTRKYFHGAACKDERAILFPILRRKYPRFDISHIPELKNPNASICAKCSRLLKRIARLERDLNNSISDVLQYLCPTLAPRKRVLSETV